MNKQVYIQSIYLSIYIYIYIYKLPVLTAIYFSNWPSSATSSFVSKFVNLPSRRAVMASAWSVDNVNSSCSFSLADEISELSFKTEEI